MASTTRLRTKREVHKPATQKRQGLALLPASEEATRLGAESRTPSVRVALLPTSVATLQPDPPNPLVLPPPGCPIPPINS